MNSVNTQSSLSLNVQFYAQFKWLQIVNLFLSIMNVARDATKSSFITMMIFRQQGRIQAVMSAV